MALTAEKHRPAPDPRTSKPSSEPESRRIQETITGFRSRIFKALQRRFVAAGLSLAKPPLQVYEKVKTTFYNPIARKTKQVASAVKHLLDWVGVTVSEEDRQRILNEEESPKSVEELDFQETLEQKRNDLGTGIVEAWKQARSIEEEHLKEMGDEFFRLLNGYRSTVDTSLPTLRQDPELMLRAQGIVRKRAGRQPGDGVHTSLEYRRATSVRQDIVLWGCHNEYDALKRFRDSEQDHHQIMTSPFRSCGYAFSKGIDGFSYLVVLFGEGETRKDNPEKKEIPERSSTLKASPKTVEEAKTLTPLLASSFMALDQEQEEERRRRKLREPLFTSDLDLSKSKSIPQDQYQEAGGAFYLTVKKGEETLSYLVTGSPPLLTREVPDAPPRRVEFYHFIQDVEQEFQRKKEERRKAQPPPEAAQLSTDQDTKRPKKEGRKITFSPQAQGRAMKPDRKEAAA